MGRFVNPGNRAFAVALRSEIYIDKTGLICLQHIIAGDAIQGKCFPDYPLAGRKVFRGI